MSLVLSCRWRKPPNRATLWILGSSKSWIAQASSTGSTSSNGPHQETLFRQICGRAGTVPARHNVSRGSCSGHCLGEFDAQTYNADIFVQRLKERMEKRLLHFHVVDEIPNRYRFLHPVFDSLPGLDKFVNNGNPLSAVLPNIRI